MATVIRQSPIAIANNTPAKLVVPKTKFAPPPEHLVEAAPPVSSGPPPDMIETSVAPPPDMLEPASKGLLETAGDWLSPSDAYTSGQLEKTLQSLTDRGVPAEKVQKLRDISESIKQAVPGPVGAALNAATKMITWNIGGSGANALEAGMYKIQDMLGDVPAEQQPKFSEYFSILADSQRMQERATAEANPVPSTLGGFVGAVASPFNKVAQLANIPKLLIPAVEGTAMAAGEAVPEIARGDYEQAGKELVSNALLASAFTATAHVAGGAAKKLFTAEKKLAATTVAATVNDRSLQDAAIDVIESNLPQEENIARAMIDAEKLAKPEKLFSGEELQLIKTRIWTGMSAAEREAADNIVTPEAVEAWTRNEVKGFASQLTGRPAESYEESVETIKSFVTRETAQEAEKRYIGRRMSEEMLLASTDVVLPAARGKMQSLRYVLDGSARVEELANRHNLEISELIGRISSGTKRTIMDEAYWLNDLKNEDGSIRLGIRSVVKKIAAAGLEPDAIRNVVEKPDKYTAVLNAMTPKQVAAKDAYVKITEDMREWALSRGLNITSMADASQGYVMHTLKPLQEIIPELLRRVRAVEKTYAPIATWTQEVFDKLAPQKAAKQVAGGAGPAADQDVNLLLWGVRYLTGDEITTPTQLINAIGKARDPGAIAARTVSKAGVSFERDIVNPMPTWLRETDVTKLLPKWVSTVASHINLRSERAELAPIAELLQKRNDALGANYLKTLATDLGGGRYDTPKATLNNALVSATAAFTNAANIASESGKPLKAAGLRALAALPELPQKVMTNLYAYWLGASPLAAIKNSTQTALLTMPHISAATGNAYGAELYARSTVRMAADMAAGRLGARFAEAQAAGLLSERAAEYYQIMKTGKAQGLGSTFASANEKLNQLAMWTFDKSERVQRMQTINMADAWAADLIAGKQDALKAVLSGTDKGYAAAIMRSVRKGNDEETQGLLRRFLLGKTQFNYDVASMSEFGRSWGPVFNMFAKWPSTIIGDVVERVEQKQYKQLMIKYGSGLAVAVIADHLATSPEERTGWEKFAIGKGSFALDWSPLGAAAGMSAMGRPAITEVAGKIGRDVAGIWKELTDEQTHAQLGDQDIVHTLGKSSWSPLLPTATFFKLFANLSDAIDDE